MAFVTLLSDWGLEEYIEAFYVEGISDQSFHLLDDDTINMIFKKCGPRLIFKQKYKEYLSTTGHDNISDQVPSEKGGEILHLNEPGCSSDISIIEFVDKYNDAIFSPQPATSSSPIVTIAVEPPTVTTKKLNSLFEGGLENLLQKSPEGRLTLLNRKKLSNDLRQKISKIVINELLSQNNFAKNGKFELGRDIFMKASEEIVRLFPREEKATYYIPFQSKQSGVRQPARGKLWSRYLNVRGALRVAEQTVLKERNTFIEEKAVVEELDKTDLIFLNAAIEPYPKILKAWENTYTQRCIMYKDCTVAKIFEDFPCLKTVYGLDLLESDFNQLYEDKIDIIYTNWPRISKAILKEAKERNVLCQYPVQDESTRSLLILPNLFSPTNLKKSNKGKKGWRPTRAEIQDSFFFYTENFDTLDEIIQRRGIKLAVYDIPLQPFACLLGDGVYCIVINETKYKCDSCIRCLELLFKAIHALNLEYPPESKHIWNFVQESVFKIPATSKNSSTACVIADINFHLYNEETQSK